MFYLNCPAENPVLTEFIKLEFLQNPLNILTPIFSEIESSSSVSVVGFIDVLFCDTELNWYQCTNRPGFDMHDSAVLHGTL